MSLPMPLLDMAIMILVMAVVTYLIRMIPFAFFRKKIKSRYLRSVLYYIPYAVLSAMTFPAIFYCTGNIYTALIGTVIALILSLFKRSLIVVALCACATVFITGLIIPLL